MKKRRIPLKALQWETSYPCRQVDSEPTSYREKLTTYSEALKVADNIEMTDDVAVEVVRYNDHYYVVYKD